MATSPQKTIADALVAMRSPAKTIVKQEISSPVACQAPCGSQPSSPARPQVEPSTAPGGSGKASKRQHVAASTPKQEKRQRAAADHTTGDAATDGGTPVASSAASPRPIPLPAGAPEPNLNKSDRAAKWAEYTRTLTAANKRGNYSASEKCPGELLTRMLGIHEKRYFFAIWLKEGGSWQRVQAFENHIHSESKICDNLSRWMTHSELAKHFHDTEIADEFVQTKHVGQEGGTWRKHPELPHVKKAMQYKILLNSDEVDRVEDSVQRGVNASMELQGEDAKEMMRDHLQRSEAILKGEPAGRPRGGQDAATGAGGSFTLEKPRGGQDAAEEPAEDKMRREEQKSRERLENQASRKAERQRLASLPENRCKAWLAGVNSHIASAESAARRARVKDNAMIKAIAKEYACAFDARVLSLQKVRRALERAIKGDIEEDLSEKVKDAENKIEGFKTDLRNFNSYYKQVNK